MCVIVLGSTHPHKHHLSHLIIPLYCKCLLSNWHIDDMRLGAEKNTKDDLDTGSVYKSFTFKERAK